MKKWYMLVLLVSMFIAKGSYACIESSSCHFNPPCQGCVNWAESIKQYCYSHNNCDPNSIVYTMCAQDWEKNCDYQYCADVRQCEDYFWVPDVGSLVTPLDTRPASCDGASYILKPAA